jgi:tRNA-2-methylthio-N6-dimethylallyladenosine synthase
MKEKYEFVQDETEASIIMLNTCSVRENANEKIYNRIHRIRQYGGKNGGKKPVLIGVLGCMATNFQTKLLENPRLKIDFIAGPDSYKRLPELIQEVSETGEKSFDTTLSEFETYSDVLPVRQVGVNAWIAVMRGCNNFCTFCVVPFTRGRERSRAPENIVEEVKKLVQEGFKQVTLLGQNVNSYRTEEHDFADLLEKVSGISGLERIRFTSPHPKDFPRKLLRVIAGNPKICKHIHLPLQAGNDRVLDKMNRTYTQKEYLEVVEDIRALDPNMSITTDIIVGFPTETDEEFQDTVKVMKQVEYDFAFIFKYSPRERTLAYKKFPDDVPEEKKTERIVLLNAIQKEISLRKNRAHIGKTQKVLVEEQQTRKSENDFQGRNDAGRIVIFPAGPYSIGDFIDIAITDASAHVLRGIPVPSASFPDIRM